MGDRKGAKQLGNWGAWAFLAGVFIWVGVWTTIGWWLWSPLDMPEVVLDRVGFSFLTGAILIVGGMWAVIASMNAD